MAWQNRQCTNAEGCDAAEHKVGCPGSYLPRSVQAEVFHIDSSVTSPMDPQPETDPSIFEGVIDAGDANDREQMARSAIEGDEWARTMEMARIKSETRVYDHRDGDPLRCYSAEIHDEHDHEQEAWAEPRWVNPRVIWKHHCPGVKDETPYERILSVQEKGVWFWKQDEAGHDFPICRRLIVSMGPSGSEVHIETEIWKKPPREWPPVHVGAAGAGLTLDREAAIAVRDFLTTYIDETEEASHEQEQPVQGG